MRSTRIAVVLICAALWTTGCARPQRVDGDARPAGAQLSVSKPSSSSPAPPTTSPSAPAPVSSSAPAHKPSKAPKKPTVLTPAGLGALKLRMTRKEAEATGMITGYKVEDFGYRCGIAHLRGSGATVYFTPGLGLSSIAASDGVRTPEGIRLGSTVAAVKKAYPDWREVTADSEVNGYGWTDHDHYRIEIRDGKVSSLVATAQGLTCVE